MQRQLRFALLATIIGALVWAPTATAAIKVDSAALREAVTLAGVRAHQQALQNIANANNGTRASGTPGFAASSNYVKGQLEAAGYTVAVQTFDFAFFQEFSPSVLEQTAPTPMTYGNGVDFATMNYSGAGDVTAAVQAVDLVLPPVGGSTSGCEMSDFPASTVGRIALIQRGTCTFNQKAANALAAGAVGVVIFNEGNTPDRSGLLLGTLGTPVNIPTVGTTFALGQTFAETAGLTLHLKTDTASEIRATNNLIAETSGRADRTVVVGAHLDSVLEGPGINDNGSGTATILEIAQQISELGISPRNKIRFAFWGAEESGLLGSEHYVSQLSARDIKNIAVNLNFDMVGSPNFVRFVYDGDGSATPDAGPNGSGVVEDVFLDYFGSLASPLASEPTAFDGRSDYGPFIAVGIPAGGLFTGAEGIKTPAQVAVYGGTAGAQYDPCYHQACDTFANNSDTALDQMSDATAHSVLAFAQTTSAVNGTDKSSAKALAAKMAKLFYRGSLLQR